MRPFIQAATFLFAVFVLISPAHAVDPVFHVDGKAIRGYDPVAYFTQEKAVEGLPAHSIEYNVATWQFASAENRELFAANPEKYAPAYGGYCAFAVANNYTASIDPDAWTIRDGKLYLNYSKIVRARWALDKSGNIAAADQNWPGLRDGS
ncbi:MAG: YHS domain-containing (seleno)protein [Alphaproteobacteria bacterium]